jgi:hypothetical protein
LLVGKKQVLIVFAPTIWRPSWGQFFFQKIIYIYNEKFGFIGFIVIVAFSGCHNLEVEILFLQILISKFFGSRK